MVASIPTTATAISNSIKVNPLHALPIIISCHLSWRHDARTPLLNPLMISFLKVGGRVNPGRAAGLIRITDWLRSLIGVLIRYSRAQPPDASDRGPGRIVGLAARARIEHIDVAGYWETGRGRDEGAEQGDAGIGKDDGVGDAALPG